jgi:spermidine/putrescine transport system permease protein
MAGADLVHHLHGHRLPVAYYIAQAQPKAQRFLYMLIMLPMCISFLLRTLAWVALLDDTGIINGFIVAIGLKPLPLIRTNAAVVLGMVYNYLPYMIMPLYTVIMKIDPRLVEAAQDLGCNSAQVFRRVIFRCPCPASSPASPWCSSPPCPPSTSPRSWAPPAPPSSATSSSQFKTAYNPNLGAALSLVLMVLVFICIGVMNRFSDDEEVATV